MGFPLITCNLTTHVTYLLKILSSYIHFFFLTRVNRNVRAVSTGEAIQVWENYTPFFSPPHAISAELGPQIPEISVLKTLGTLPSTLSVLILRLKIKTNEMLKDH